MTSQRDSFKNWVEPFSEMCKKISDRTTDCIFSLEFNDKEHGNTLVKCAPHSIGPSLNCGAEVKRWKSSNSRGKQHGKQKIEKSSWTLQSSFSFHSVMYLQ